MSLAPRPVPPPRARGRPEGAGPGPDLGAAPQPDRALDPAPEQASGLTPEDSQQVRATQLRLASAAGWKATLSGIGGALLLTLAADQWLAPPGSARQLGPWLWWLALSTSWGVATAMALAFDRPGRSDAAFLQAERAILANNAVSALAFGSASWVFLPSANPLVEQLVLISCTMTLVGAAGTLGVYRPLLVGFLAIAATVFSAGLLRIADTFHVLAGLGFLILSFVILTIATKMAAAIEAAIGLRLQTERLLQRSRQQQRETDEARAEAELSRQQAEQANAAKTAFLAAAGHDLRQPTHALVQYHGQLRRSNQDAGLDELVARMGLALEAMQGLLDAIAEVSQLMLGAVRPVMASFSIGPLLQRMDAQLRPVAEAKGLRLAVQGAGHGTGADGVNDADRADGVHDWVCTDERLLERILVNLTANAIRYTAQGGVLLRVTRRGGRLRFRVADTGIGMAQDQHQRIFEPFYQVGNVARDRQKGLGLGLAIVKQLCQLLALPLRLRSRPGRGTVFSVEVPLVDRPDGAHCGLPERLRTAHAPGAFVVVVDDDAASLLATSSSLALLGCQVLGACSSAQAIAQLQQQALPHLVISDYRLNGETGLQALARVHEALQLQFGDDFSVRSLLVSGDTAPAELHAIHQAGLVLLRKPVRLETLQQAVEAELQALRQ